MLQLRNRVFFLFIVMSLLITALAGRLFYIQVIWRDELSEMAKSQQNRTIVIPARRGEILDRKGDKLAFSIRTYSLWANAQGITKPLETAQLIAETIDADVDVITNTIINATSAYVRIVRDLTKAEADLIRSKGIRGISVAEDSKRIYPYDNLASHVLGNVNSDHDGFLGVELFYNTLLKGEPGNIFVTTDVYGRQLAHGEELMQPPLNGHSLVLTLDDTIQFFVEQRLQEAYELYDAKKVSALVMNPNTGEILAMASKPDFNLNDPRKVRDDMDALTWQQMTPDERMTYWGEMWRNPVVSDTYEPGSTFKAVTAAMGLEESIVTLESTSTCRGFVMVNGVRLRCWVFPGSHGYQTLKEAFANSCNPTFIGLSEKIGVERFYTYLERFGLLSRTGIDLPAETSGLSLAKDRVGPIELATLSYGHGISVNMVQVASAVSAMVNGGELMKPQIIREVIDDSGAVIRPFQPIVENRVISQKTSDEMRVLFEAAVESGGGRYARIPGITVGGKTGTSTKVVDGVYQDDVVVASFVGIAPMEDPQYVVLVLVDEPQVDFGGSIVAAPIVKNILEDILRYENIVPSTSKSIRVEVPDLRNKPLEEAVRILEEMGLRYTTDPLDVFEEQAYVIVDQFPKAGQIMDSNTLIILSIEEK